MSTRSALAGAAAVILVAAGGWILLRPDTKPDTVAYSITDIGEITVIDESTISFVASGFDTECEEFGALQIADDEDEITLWFANATVFRNGGFCPTAGALFADTYLVSLPTPIGGRPISQLLGPETNATLQDDGFEREGFVPVTIVSCHFEGDPRCPEDG